MVLECARGPEPLSPPPPRLRSRTCRGIPTTGEFTERQRGFGNVRLHHFCLRQRLLAAFRRKRTGTTDWDEARDCARTLEAAGSWDGKPIVADAAA